MAGLADERPTPTRRALTPTWWLNYVHFTDQAREGKRPLLFHRCGSGNHRYQIGYFGRHYFRLEVIGVSTFVAPRRQRTSATPTGVTTLGSTCPAWCRGPNCTRARCDSGLRFPCWTSTTSTLNAERRISAYPEPYWVLVRGVYHLRYGIAAVHLH